MITPNWNEHEMGDEDGMGAVRGILFSIPALILFWGIFIYCII